MVPPLTPSPHRFVIKKEPPVRKTPLFQSQTPGHSSHQFNATPRFNFSSTPRANPSQELPLSTQVRYLTPAQPLQWRAEVAETSSDGLQDVHDSIETEDMGTEFGDLSQDVNETYELEEPYRKRRRFSPFTEELALAENQGEEPRSSPPPLLSSPPISRRLGKAPKYIFASPSQQSTSKDPPTPFVHPPRFLPLETSDETQSLQDPLPDQFSPHRRGQKYIPGGMATEVRDWLINLESTSPATRAQRTDNLWLLKIRIDEVSGNSRTGLTMVKGSQEGGGARLKILLAGEGEGTGLQKGARVELGRTVGIKGMVWDIVIEGEKWGVSVDWKVLV